MYDELRQTIKKYTGSDLEIQRLPDREYKRGSNHYRKSVFLLLNNGIPQFVIHKFHPRFKQIFDNYRRAREILPSAFTGMIQVIDEDNLMVLMSYQGKPCNPFHKLSLSKIVHILKEINEISVCRNIFHPPRYLLSVLFLNSQEKHFELDPLSRLVNVISTNKIYQKLGCGVEDPAISNFTFWNDSPHIVDMDNFTTSINLSYEIGFFVADLEIEMFGKPKSEDLKSIEKRAGYYSNSSWNESILGIGYLSRLVTNLIDTYSDMSDSRNDISIWEYIINRLSHEILVIL
jgi:hypothetical protein